MAVSAYRRKGAGVAAASELRADGNEALRAGAPLLNLDVGKAVVGAEGKGEGELVKDERPLNAAGAEKNGATRRPLLHSAPGFTDARGGEPAHYLLTRGAGRKHGEELRAEFGCCAGTCNAEP